MKKTHLEKTWWVKKNALLAGCFPGDIDKDKASKRLQCLLDAGVRVFISLQEPNERSPQGPFAPYMPIVKQLAQVAGIEVEFVNFPIRDNGVPSTERMTDILSRIRNAHISGRCVYLHCWGGHGRTATVVGCWLREQGLAGEEALEQIVELRRHDPHLVSMMSPQTSAQREMILSWEPRKDGGMLSRAQGCLLGQLAGDALGSLVEFQTPESIHRRYPDGVRELADGGTFNTIAGQPTDDSEMALLLARMLVERKTYDANAARTAYVYWLDSGPFDCGMTVSSGLRGRPNPGSQANGAMMRISPLGIFGANHPVEAVGDWARQDAALTHPNPVCLQASALFSMAIAQAIASGGYAEDLYQNIRQWAIDLAVEPALVDAIHGAAESPPPEYVQQQGWVLTAFRNALWQLLHAPNLEAGVVNTVMRGGDTDTNAAICGALLGAVYGLDALPAQWVDRVLNCRPKAGHPGVHRPRPECFWPVDALDLAEKLLSCSSD
jgi:ADP-ribosylglycohydrolase